MVNQNVKPEASREARLLVFDEDFRLVELTRSRRRKFRAAITQLGDIPDDSEDDDLGVKLVAQAVAACVDSEELEERIVEAWMNDAISEAAVGRMLESVVRWEDGEDALGEA